MLTFRNWLGIFELEGTFPTVESLRFENVRQPRLSIESLLKLFPNIRTIEYPSSEELTICYDRKVNEPIVFRLPWVFIKRISVQKYGTSSVPELGSVMIFAPFLSPGKAAPEIRCQVIETFLTHPEWYDDKATAMYQMWILKNGISFLPLCMKNGYMNLLNKLVFEQNIPFTSAAFDAIIQAAEDQKDTALKAAFIGAKEKHHDLAKINQRMETLASNDLENPLRPHAMQRLWSWSNQEDGTLCIKKLKYDTEAPMMESSILIPSEIAGKKVAEVTGAVFRESQAEEIIFPESIEWIRGKVLEGNRAIQRVRFLGPVRIIPESAFSGCENIKSITFCDKEQWIGRPDDQLLSEFQQEYPEKLDSIVILRKAFEYCYRIEGVRLNRAVLEDSAFYNSGLRRIHLRDVMAIPKRCFESCTMLELADIQGTVVIGPMAFYGCSDLQELHVSDSLTSVGTQAFAYCKKLSRIYLHNVSRPGQIRRLFQNNENYRKIEFIQTNEP